jgi:hypothetical protein
MATFTAVFDSCVLYPAPLRDLLMRVAMTDLVRARWTDRIHDEWIAAVLQDRPDLNREQLERTRSLMNAHARDALVTDYEHLIETVQLPDPDDRHVLAAAIRSRSELIVTCNLKDFPADRLAPYGIELRHPDTFVSHLIDLAPAVVCAAAKRQRQALRHPPMDVESFLECLARQRLPETVARLALHDRLL